MRHAVAWVALIVATAATTSCAMRVPRPRGLPSGVPHISWIIMHGDRENPDSEFACQSTGPSECVLPASRPDTRVFSDVHLYLHGTGSQTTYLGTYRVNFFNGGDTSLNEFQIRTTLPGNEKIANQSVTGIVTSTRGRYVLRIAADATTAAGPTPIRQDVPVQVQ